ncbi:MAG: hypothetical protein J2P37_28845, partial [Ktedonobacteraceae bacterium]|nr:hypothetical protein [Ktedonobacteraceae bacterium]
RDQCFVEQKNGAVVRQFVGHDRLAGQQAYQQLRELYQTLHLYVNCFQPSMKLQSKRHDGTRVRRVYDPAKTPLQRLLLSEALSSARKHELSEIAQALDPIGLLHQVRQLQQALSHGTVNALPFSHHASTSSILRFFPACCPKDSLPFRASETATPPSFQQAQHQGTNVLDWPRTTRDPFAGEWERILAWILAQPELSLGEILQELQRLSPRRYTPSHLGTLQRSSTSATSGLYIRQGQAANLSYRLVITSGKIGENAIDVALTDTSGQLIQKADAVIVRFTMLDMAMGVQEEELQPIAHLLFVVLLAS